MVGLAPGPMARRLTPDWPLSFGFSVGLIATGSLGFARVGLPPPFGAITMGPPRGLSGAAAMSPCFLSLIDEAGWYRVVPRMMSARAGG